MKVLSGEAAKIAYRNFCEGESSLPIFAEDWYLDHCCKEGEWQAILVLQDNKVIATYTYFLKRKWGLQYITMPLFVKWMGLYILPEFRQHKWEARILRQLIPHIPKVNRSQQNFFPSSFNWSPLYWNGFQQTTYYTYQLDLTVSQEQLFSAIHYNTRRSIRQALFTLDTDISPQDFYHINAMSFTRQGIDIPYDYKTFLTHYNTLLAHESIHLLGARNTQGEMCGVCCLIWDKMICYYHFSGDHPDFRKDNVGVWMIWQAVLFAHERLPATTFDFEGSMLEGVAAVKRRLNAKPVPYYFIQKDRHLMFRLRSSIRRL
ncbi:MAG: GNAT family N-acetyltransferase [Bacteroidota bacterium]